MSTASEKFEIDKEQLVVDATPVNSIEEGTPVDTTSSWGFFHKLSAKLDSFGVEQRGIARVLPEERVNNRNLLSQFLSVMGLWASATGGISNMSSFVLPTTVFELEFRQALVCSLVGCYFGAAVSAFCSTLGPQSGCRQMVTARYLFGWWFVKFIAILGTVIAGIGWSVVNTVLSGEILTAVSGGDVPNWIGIILVSVVSIVISVFGIKVLYKVEKYYSVVIFITLILFYICMSNRYDVIYDFSNSDVPHNTMTGNWLSMFSITWSGSATWAAITSDYYIMFPETTPKWQIFSVTFFGIIIPTTFVAVAGNLLSAICVSDPEYITAYKDGGVGGAIVQAFGRWNGFGKFLVVLLWLSLIASTILNTYSGTFAFQLAGKGFTRVPRWVWAIVFTVVYFVCAIAGRDHFSTILSNFLPMIGYWIAMYFIMLLEEDLGFRKFAHHLYTKEFPNEEFSESEPHKFKYNWDQWNNINVLTHGIAATTSFICGIAGAVLGMAQVYYVGPAAAHFGPAGGDLGMWLTMGISGVLYPPLRYWELKKFGR